MTDHAADFFAFARERHSIYLRRQAGQNPPFTHDEILRKYRFTNVFRELDRTTVWFREHVRDRFSASPDVLLATVVFRWFNRITTGEAIFSQPSLEGETAWDHLLRTGDASSVRASVLQYCGSGPYVTGAYIIKTPDGMSKLDGVLQCIEWFMKQKHIVSGESSLVPHPTNKLGWRQVAEDFIAVRDYHPDNRGTLHGMWEWLRKFPFLGDFMSYEIVTDLRWTDLLSSAPDILTWANPGPGATRGLGRVFGESKDQWDQRSNKTQLILMMQDLLSMSRDAGYWPQRLPWQDHDDWYTDNYEFDRRFQAEDAWPQWEMRDVEHTLCEFDKYERARTGEGRPRGVFSK